MSLNQEEVVLTSKGKVCLKIRRSIICCSSWCGKKCETVKFRPLLRSLKKFIVLKFRHVVYHFESNYLEDQKYSLFREIFKYCENVINNRFRKIL